jgi:hypothetical protein
VQPGAGAFDQLRVERSDDASEKIGQRGTPISVERSEDRVLAGDQVFQCSIHTTPTGRRELHPHRTSVQWIRTAANQTSLFEVVNSIRHGARRDERLCHQLPGRELVRRVGSPQGREHVKRPDFKIVTGKDGRALAVQVSSQAADTREHLERGDIEIRERPMPARDESIDFVLHASSRVFQTYLDIEMLSSIIS